MPRKSDPKNTTKINIDMQQNTMVEIKHLIREKLVRIQEIIKNTQLYINRYRSLNLCSASDTVMSNTTLCDCYSKSMILLEKTMAGSGENPFDNATSLDQLNNEINILQTIIDKLSIVISSFGTGKIEDIFFISFGTDFIEMANLDKLWKDKIALLFQYFHPTGYKTYHWKQMKAKPKEAIGEPFSLCKNKIIADTVQIEMSSHFECFDVDTTVRSLHMKIHGCRVVVHNEKTQKTLVVHGFMDDILLDILATNTYVESRKKAIMEKMPVSDTFDREIMQRIVDTMSLKDVLVFGDSDIHKRHISIISEVNSLKYNKLNISIKKFLELDIYHQRQMLVHLLIYQKDDEIQYITYLLYNLITSKEIQSIDSPEQIFIYDSLPWKVKLLFKETMTNTLENTKQMLNKYDINRVSLEQQIFVMKVPEHVREKAMSKLKEIKGKSDDYGAKAKQYLEGLLKIPFNIYSEEPVLKKIKTYNKQFIETTNSVVPYFAEIATIPAKKEKYTNMEIANYSYTMLEELRTISVAHSIDFLKKLNVKQLNQLLHSVMKKPSVAANSGVGGAGTVTKQGAQSMTKQEKIDQIMRQMREMTPTQIIQWTEETINANIPIYRGLASLESVYSQTKEIHCDLENIIKTLDDSIYGHSHAKNQILKIIAQWMNGEQSGYCFGFEGSPGVGKTSLAKKGLAHCLKDEQGNSRPFSFIAIGGSSNGSTLEGHSYTYVNSTYGRIAEILMESKCMNPIIYVDELDKVSKTEHGKEIIGILTHLIDPTQNTGFQDKYFSGIDLDLSKALFVFSYNDPQSIDKILLDRIHRINFDNLTMEEKIVIVRKYIIPEINRKMGMIDTVVLTDEMITYLIEKYTLEPGVRKLKEVLFDLFGEINIEMLKYEHCHSDNTPIELPVVITVENIEKKYLAKYSRVNEKKIHKMAEIGVINGLWANAYGCGGIIPIQTMFYPTTTFLELRLTGMQGDVMKESMNVAKSLAWNLLPKKKQEELVGLFERTKCQGLHIHCPEGAVSKDGPSAGAAITLAILSLFLGEPVSNTVAITGEINLQGCVTEIGGLEHKIAGGVRAGIRKFLYPRENKKDFDKFFMKMGELWKYGDIEFMEVETIHDTFSHFFINGNPITM
jgi:hypothetical protein